MSLMAKAANNTSGVDWYLLPPPSVFSEDGDMCRRPFEFDPKRKIASTLHLCSDNDAYALRIDEARGREGEWPPEIVIDKADWPDGPFTQEPTTQLVLVREYNKPSVTYRIKESEVGYATSDPYRGLLYTIANATSFLKPINITNWALIDRNPFCIDNAKLLLVHYKPPIIDESKRFINEMQTLLSNTTMEKGKSIILQALLPPCFDQKFNNLLPMIEAVRNKLVFVLMPVILALGITNISTVTSQDINLHRSLIAEPLIADPSIPWPKDVWQLHESILRFEQELLTGATEKQARTPRNHIVERVALFAFLRFMIEAMRSSELTCRPQIITRVWHTPEGQAYINTRKALKNKGGGGNRQSLTVLSSRLKTPLKTRRKI